MVARITQQFVQALGAADGEARITQQYVDALGHIDGAVRVTKVFVEVMSTVPGGEEHEENASNTLSLSGTATGVNLSQSASNTLSLTQDLEIGAPKEATASNTLSLIQSADTLDIIAVSATSVLAIIQTLEKNDLISISVGNTLALVSSEETAGPINESATNVLSLTGEATNNVKLVSATNVLNLIQTQELADTFEESVSNTLALTQSTDVSPKIVSVSSTLALAQLSFGDTVVLSRSASNDLGLDAEATVDRIIVETVLSPLDLDDEVIQGVISVTATNVLNLIQTVVGPKPASASNTLTLFGEARSSIIPVSVETELDLFQITTVKQPIYVSAENQLTIYQTETDGSETPISGLIQSVEVQQSVININLVTYLSLSQSAGQVHEETASNTMSLTQEMFRIWTSENSLTLSQTLVGLNGRGVSNVLDLTSVATFNLEGNVLPENTLALVQALAYYVIGETTDKTYNRFGPLPVAPTLGSGTFTLTYPYVTPTTTLVLRNPNFNNGESFSVTRISRETRSGSLIIFRDSTWPEIETLSVEIDNLKIDDKNNLLQFFEDSLGVEVGLLDHEGRQWRGFITTPEALVSEVQAGRFNVGFSFEGTLA